MRAAPRPKSIREPQEVLFVDRVQHFDSGTLDDLIFQCGETPSDEVRPALPTFGMYTLRTGLARYAPRLEPLGEIVEVFLKGLSVLLPRLAVYAPRQRPALTSRYAVRSRSTS